MANDTERAVPMGQARELVERWWSLFEAGRIEESAQLGVPDVEVWQPGGVKITGRAALVEMLTAFYDGFPSITHEIVDCVEAGDKVAVELRITNVHSGIFRTPLGDIPPTGRTIVIESVDMVTVRNGKIISWHTYFDQMSFLGQLGLLPEPSEVS
jgi:steroid delta-isomerase-like uncharacterized protein